MALQRVHQAGPLAVPQRDPEWVVEVREKIQSLANKNVIPMEDFIRVLFFLDQEASTSTYWNSLRMLVNNEQAFRTYIMVGIG